MCSLEFTLIFIRVDENNALIDSMKEMIKREGLTFNMQQFSEKYAAGKLCLMQTETWLARHVMRSNLPLLKEGKQAVYFALHLNATMDLVLERRKITRDSVPELYENDAHRLLKFQNEFYLITTCMAIFKVTSQSCDHIDERMEVCQFCCFFVFLSI